MTYDSPGSSLRSQDDSIAVFPTTTVSVSTAGPFQTRETVIRVATGLTET